MKRGAGELFVPIVIIRCGITVYLEEVEISIDLSGRGAIPGGDPDLRVHQSHIVGSKQSPPITIHIRAVITGVVVARAGYSEAKGCRRFSAVSARRESI